MVQFRETRPPIMPERVVRPANSLPGLSGGAEKRRSVRVNSRVPLAVEWQKDGQLLCKETHTRVVNTYGCLVMFPQNLELQQRVKVTNLVSRESIPAVVVWRGSERNEEWELGVELVNPGMDFWGLDL